MKTKLVLMFAKFVGNSENLIPNNFHTTQVSTLV